jgi:hypothetical protein
MQKAIVQGIPFWKDKSNNLYSFETDKKNCLNLGTYNTNTEKYTLKDDWHPSYNPRLNEYRINLKKRERKDNKDTKDTKGNGK